MIRNDNEVKKAEQSQYQSLLSSLICILYSTWANNHRRRQSFGLGAAKYRSVAAGGGFGRGSSPPAMGSGGIIPGKFSNFHIAVDDFWCIFMDQKVVLYTFTVLGEVLCTIGLGSKQASSSCSHCFE